MKTLALLSFLTILTLSGCSMTNSGDNGESEGNLPGKDQNVTSEKITISTKEQFSLLSSTTKVRFVEVREDSRCPIEVTCVWEGQVVLVLQLEANGQDVGTFTMSGYVGPDGYRDAQEKRITAETGGYRFLLERVTPFPVADGPRPTSHTAVLEVTKL